MWKAQFPLKSVWSFFPVRPHERSKDATSVVDRMDFKQLLPYLHEHKSELIESIRIGRYKPNSVRRVDIAKDNGKKRLIGIPTVVDRLIQQAIVQVLSPIYERQFSPSSFGFRPDVVRM